MTFKIVTWNIENFAKESDGETNQHYAAKLDHVTERLRTLEPDVVALQEVLDEDALGELARATERRAIAGIPDGRGNRVAFLVRPDAQFTSAPIPSYNLSLGARVQELDADGKVHDSEGLSRPPLSLTLTHAGHPITLINAHLKSKLHTYPGGRFSTDDEGLRAAVAYFDLVRRAAEAATIRATVTEILRAPDARAIVLGDLNDGPHAATTEILYGPPGSQLQSPEDSQRQRSEFSREDDGDRQRLFNITKLVPEVQRWSRETNNIPELIDHILCSEHMMSGKAKLRSVPVVEILNDRLQSVTERPRKDTGIPDHAAIVASFEL